MFLLTLLKENHTTKYRTNVSQVRRIVDRYIGRYGKTHKRCDDAYLFFSLKHSM